MSCSHSQLYPTLCNPMDCSPPGSSVCGIFQARILKWVAIFSSRVFPTQGLNLCLLHWQGYSLPLSNLRSPTSYSVLMRSVKKYPSTQERKRGCQLQVYGLFLRTLYLSCTLTNAWDFNKPKKQPVQRLRSKQILVNWRKKFSVVGGVWGARMVDEAGKA